MMKKSAFELVGEFHKKFGLPISGKTMMSIIEREAFEFRQKFIQEELDELAVAQRNEDLAGVADALADIVYVALGTAHFYGIPFDEVFAEVHFSNMQKERSTDNDPRSKRKSPFDVVKPRGWIPPRIIEVLQQAADRWWGNMDERIDVNA